MVLGMLVRAVQSYWPVLVLLIGGAILVIRAAFDGAHYRALS